MQKESLLNSIAPDELLSAGIERKFEIIGEALVRVRNRFPEDLDGISGWTAIVGFRNLLAHGYDRIDETVVWGIVTNQIPSLIKELSAIEGIEGGSRRSAFRRESNSEDESNFEP